MSIENLTIVIPFRDGHKTIDRLLDSLPQSIPVIVVDDLSAEPYITGRQNVRVIRRESRGYFAGATNVGISSCTTDVLILNQDCWMEGSAWIEQVKRWQSEGYGVAGSGVFKHPAWERGYVEGQFMFISRKAIDELGMVLDEEFYPLWGCTAEFQLRACRAGFKALPVRMSEYGLRHERGDKPYGSSIAETLKTEPEKQNLFVRTPPMVSVIITTYKQAAYLADAVHSLVGGETCMGIVPPQTFQDFEIVIVDDASPDHTREIGAALADPWQAIRYLRLKENVGSAAAANFGIKHSFGKYIAMLDGDDMFAPTRLEKLVRTLQAKPHHFAYDDLTYFKHAHAFYQHRLPDYDFDITLRKNQIHKGIVFERAAHNEIGGYPETMRYGREDWAINIALGAKGYCGIHLAEPLYLYRREGQNRSLTNTEDLGWRRFFIQQLHELFPQLYAGERPKMCCGSSKTVKSKNGNGANMKVTIVNPEPSGRGARGARGAAVPGQGGMELLEYIGGGSSVLRFDGPATHAKYVFGGKRARGYVDVHDVDGFLLKRGKDGKPMFARVPSPTLQVASVPPVVAEVEETVTNLPPEVAENVPSALDVPADEPPIAVMSADTPAKRLSGRKKKAA